MASILLTCKAIFLTLPPRKWTSYSAEESIAMGIIFLDPNEGDHLRDRINGDREFKLAAKFFSKDILLRVSESKCMVKVQDGVITQIRINPAPMDPWSFCIAASAESWGKFLQSYPPPFFFDLYGAVVRQNFEVGGDIEALFTHFWAVTRMLDLMRQIQNEQVTEKK